MSFFFFLNISMSFNNRQIQNISVLSFLIQVGWLPISWIFFHIQNIT